METTIVYWGYIGTMENKMDIWGYYMAYRGYKGGYIYPNNGESNGKETGK